MTRLSIDSLHVAFGQKEVLRDVSLTLESGSLIGLIGPNGAGKSTLMRAIARLIEPERGSIMLNGRDCSSYSRRDLSREIAYLPQGQVVHWPLDVRQLVALGRLPHLARFSSIAARDRQAVTRALEKADASDFAHRVATTLSGGERARVMLARALAVEAPILLADEPVASLDPFHQLQVMELLRDIAKEGRLIIAVLHDLPLATRFCQRLILLGEGRVVADGVPEAVLAHQHLQAAYHVEGLYGVKDAERYVLPWRRFPQGGRSSEEEGLRHEA